MRFIDLKYIKTVAEEGTVSKAASKLFISQPSLSNAIKKIETDMGVTIFTRTKNGLVLTQIGNKYYMMANNILKIYADFENELSEIDQMAKGKSHFGITNYIGSILLPFLLPKFEKIAPDFDISFEENSSRELIEHLKVGKIDFAVLHVDPSFHDDPAIEIYPVNTSRLLLATAKNHPLCSDIKKLKGQNYPLINISRLQDERFILTDYDQMSRSISKRIFRAHNVTPQRIVVTRNIITAARLASTGFGVTFYPEIFMDFIEHDQNLDFYALEDGSLSDWELVVATLSQNYLPNATRYLTKLIQEYFHEA